ncbi:unnamed protein product [Lathyrus sativus]|nr:unnamed protein product [Lathyrus sativus]
MENAEAETSNGKPSAAVVQEYLVEAYETKVAEKKKLLVPISLVHVKDSKEQVGQNNIQYYFLEDSKNVGMTV